MAQPLTTRLVRRSALAEGIVDFELALVTPAAITFRAGQFVTLAVGKDQNGHDVRRSYSIASRSDRGESLRLILRLVPGGPGSDFFSALNLGDEVRLTGPHGFFVLDPQHAGDVVFAATGTGLAPVLPMLAELAARTEPGRRFVYWGAREERDLFVPEEIAAACAAAGASLHTYLSRPEETWSGLRGRITPAVLEALPALQDPTFYIVGNGAMIQELKRGLIERGIDRKRHIRTEAFFD
jgi:CDP-4-dehydro-6-deoxyglucose reductase, E3